MIKRISALLLALMILISVVPASVYATVYEIGKEYLGDWGSVAPPSGEIPDDSYWGAALEKDEDGIYFQKYETRGECPQEHDGACGSFDCITANIAYWWILNASGSGNGGGYVPPSGGGSNSGNSGADEDRGTVSIEILTVGTDGKPLEGVTYILSEIYTKDDDGNQGLQFLCNDDTLNLLLTQIDAQNQENQSKLEELEEQQSQTTSDSQTSQQSIEDFASQANAVNEALLEELQAGDYQIDPVTTGSDGKAYFNALENYMEAAESSVTWYLVQDGASFSSGTSLEQYAANTTEWQVNISRNGAAYSVSMVPGNLTKTVENGLEVFKFSPVDESSLKSITGYQEGYANGVLTVINEFGLCGLYFKMNFEGLTGTPDDLTANVVISGENYSKTIRFPVEKTLINNGWESEVTGLEPGEYTITAEVPVSESLEGYTYETTSYTVKTSAVDSSTKEGVTTVALSKDVSHALFTITHHYKTGSGSDNSGTTDNPSNTIIIYAENTQGTTLSGAEFGLFTSKTSTSPVRTFAGEVQYVVDDLADYAEDGKTVSLYLRQTVAPTGYDLSEDSYTISITKNNGAAQVTLTKDTSFLANLFSSGTSLGPNNEQLAIFTNTRTVTKDTSNTVVIMTVDDLGNELDGAEYSLAKKTLDEDDEFFIDNWEDYAVEGKTVEYTIMQTKAPAGYTMSSETYIVEITATNGVIDVQMSKGGSLFSNKNVETGANGEWLAIFTNPRKTTQIEMDLDVKVDFSDAKWEDKNLRKEYQSKEYQFLLEWEDGGIAQKSETLTLTHGDESKSFKTKLPLGSSYKISAKNNDGLFTTIFNGDSDGTIKKSQLSDNISISATNKYVIEAGDDDTDLYMIKVNSSTKKPLEGAKFSLRDSNDYERELYKTEKDGEIDIVNKFDAPGEYVLKEVTAPDGYDKLNKPIEISVSVSYTPKRAGVQYQHWSATVSHKSVEVRDDGTYLIKNTLSGDNPKTGDGFDVGLWIKIMAISAIGAALLITQMVNRKRKAN